MGPKTRTAPWRIRQRCCPLLVRYVVTRSMGKTPAGVDPGPPPRRGWLQHDYSDLERLWPVPNLSEAMSKSNDSKLLETSLSAAALAGGQSRRMGTDKALLPLLA